MKINRLQFAAIIAGAACGFYLYHAHKLTAQEAELTEASAAEELKHTKAELKATGAQCELEAPTSDACTKAAHDVEVIAKLEQEVAKEEAEEEEEEATEKAASEEPVKTMEEVSIEEEPGEGEISFEDINFDLPEESEEE